MHTTIHRPIFIVLLGIVFSSTAFAQAKLVDDVVGIRLGMSAEQVRSAIKAHDPEMKFKDAGTWEARPGVPPSLASIEGCKAKPHVTYCIEKIAVWFGQASRKAYYIHRDMSFYGEVLHQTAVDSILKKYGDPNYKADSNNYIYRWLYDTSDIEIKNPNTRCISSGSPPAVVHPGCGITIDAYIPKTKGALADTMWINVFDHRLLMENIAKVKAQGQEFQKNKENQAKNGKVNL
ncbi:MAG: hypothetical protein ACXWJZ_01925 [Burkholderiaceae bacterium]